MAWEYDDDGVDPEWDEIGQSGTIVQGGTKLEQLANVSVPSGEAEDQNILVYSTTTKLWTPVLLDVVSGVLSFNSRAGIVIPALGDYTISLMGDVNLAGLQDDEILQWRSNPGVWQPGTIPPVAPVDSVFGRIGAIVAEEGDYNLELLGDVTLTAPQTDEVLTYDGNGWINQAIDAGVISVFGRTGIVVAVDGDYDFDQIGKVDVPAPNAGDHLVFNNISGNWEAASGVDFLTDLGDVTIGGIPVATGQTLRYDGLGWVNAVLAAGDVSSAGGGTIAVGTDVQSDLDAIDAELVRIDQNPSAVYAEPVTTARNLGGILTGVNATTGHITAGDGAIIDSYTDYLNPVVTPVSWIDQDIPLLNPTTALRTYVSVDSSGTIVTSNNGPSPTVERTRIVIGYLFHDVAQTDPPIPFNTYIQLGTMGHLLVDFLDYIDTPLNGATLEANVGFTAKRNSGSAFIHGINEAVDPTNPNVLQVPEVDPIPFYYMLGDGSFDTGIETTLFDNLNYDPGGLGVKTLVSAAGGGARSTIQYVFAIAPGVNAVLYGQTEYTDLTTAQAAVDLDISNLVIPDNLADVFGPVYAVGLRQGGTDMSDPLDSFIVNLLNQSGGSSGGGGGGDVQTVFGRSGDVVALDGDYNLGQLGDAVINTPTNGQYLVYNGTNWVNTTVSPGGGATSLDELSDVTIASPLAGHTLVNDGLGQFVNELLVSSHVIFSPTGDVSSGNVQDAIAELDTEKLAIADAVINLDDLADVVIAGATTGQLLQRMGNGNWENIFVAGAWITNVPAGTIAATNVQDALNELDSAIQGIVPGAGQLSELSDVANTLSPADTQILRFSSGSGTWDAVSLQASEVAATPTAPVTGADVQAQLTSIGGLIGVNQSDIAALDGIKPNSDPSGVTGADQITNMMSLTQAEYDAIGAPDAATLYMITD